MIQYILNLEYPDGTRIPHIEDFRTKEKMEEYLSNLKEKFKDDISLEDNPYSFKICRGNTSCRYYVTEREIEDW